jgi:hypothetical protein
MVENAWILQTANFGYLLIPDIDSYGSITDSSNFTFGRQVLILLSAYKFKEG